MCVFAVKREDVSWPVRGELGVLVEMNSLIAPLVAVYGAVGGPFGDGYFVGANTDDWAVFIVEAAEGQDGS